MEVKGIEFDIIACASFVFVAQTHPEVVISKIEAPPSNLQRDHFYTLIQYFVNYN